MINDNELGLEIARELHYCGFSQSNDIEEYYNYITYTLELLNKTGIITDEEYKNIDIRINKAFGYNV